MITDPIVAPYYDLSRTALFQLFHAVNRDIILDGSFDDIIFLKFKLNDILPVFFVYLELTPTSDGVLVKTQRRPIKNCIQFVVDGSVKISRCGDTVEIVPALECVDQSVVRIMYTVTNKIIGRVKQFMETINIKDSSAIHRK